MEKKRAPPEIHRNPLNVCVISAKTIFESRKKSQLKIPQRKEISVSQIAWILAFFMCKEENPERNRWWEKIFQG